MNSGFGKPSNSSQTGSASLNNFDFDFGLGSNFSNNNRSRPLKDPKHPSPPTSSSSSSSFAQSRPAWTPNKPSWTHQPAPAQQVRPVTATASLSNATSMVGDIFGRSWNSMAPPSSSGSEIGIVEKNPNLFGDLLGSALGQGKTGSNAPLRNAAPIKSAATATATATKSAYSMGDLGNSLPKTGAHMKSGGNWGSGNLGFSSGNGNSGGNLGGPSIRSGGGASGTGNKDPFGSLVDFSSKKEMGGGNVRTGNGNGNSNSGVDDSFGVFQNASKSSAPPPPPFSSSQSNGNNNVGLNLNSGSKMDSFGDFGIPVDDFGSQKQAPSKSSNVDPLDAFFGSSTASSAPATAAPVGSGVGGSEPFSEIDEWNLGSEFGGNDMGSTTELEGLPPPPAGVTASAAKDKGLDNYKQGQHADAIKWLSWAFVLLEKAGDDATITEVLSCRASCYKEVGEYKKAIADCTKVLASDESNVSVLVQRALLYESSEKYKLGAEDLRTVLKIDPGNRLARSTIHRLTKLAD